MLRECNGRWDKVQESFTWPMGYCKFTRSLESTSWIKCSFGNYHETRRLSRPIKIHRALWKVQVNKSRLRLGNRALFIIRQKGFRRFTPSQIDQFQRSMSTEFDALYSSPSLPPSIEMVTLSSLVLSFLSSLHVVWLCPQTSKHMEAD